MKLSWLWLRCVEVDSLWWCIKVDEEQPLGLRIFFLGWKFSSWSISCASIDWNNFLQSLVTGFVTIFFNKTLRLCFEVQVDKPMWLEFFKLLRLAFLHQPPILPQSLTAEIFTKSVSELFSHHLNSRNLLILHITQKSRSQLTTIFSISRNRLRKKKPPTRPSHQKVSRAKRSPCRCCWLMI